MSILAVTWVFTLPIKPASHKLTLLALADYANESLLCYPSLVALEQKTSLDRKTIITALADLQVKGYISDTGRKIGRTKSIPVYKMCEIPAFKDHTIASTENGIASVSNAGEAVPFFRGSSTENGTRNHKEPSIDIILSETVKTDDCARAQRTKFSTDTYDNGYVAPPAKLFGPPSAAGELADFEHCFNKYLWEPNPKKTGKPNAMKAAAKLSPADFKKACQEIGRFIGDWHVKIANNEGQYIPHLATFLNQRRWEDQVAAAGQQQASQAAGRSVYGRAAADAPAPAEEIAQDDKPYPRFTGMSASRRLEVLAMDEYDQWRLATNPEDAPAHIKAEWARRD